MREVLIEFNCRNVEVALGGKVGPAPLVVCACASPFITT